MGITKKDVEYVARLARLNLTEQEKEIYTPQLESVLQYIEQLNELDTAKVVPTAHPFFSRTVWREDAAKLSGQRDSILKNAPESEDGFFKVRKVIE